MYKFQYGNSVYTYTNIHNINNVILNIGSSSFYSNLFQDVNNKHIVHLDLQFFTEEILPFNNNNMSMYSLVEDIEYFRNKFQINKFTIMAHGAFGYIAMEYSKKYKKFINKIILIGTGELINEENFQRLMKNYFSNNDKTFDRQQQLEINLQKPKNYKSIFIDRMNKFSPMLWYDYQHYNEYIYDNVIINEKLIYKYFNEILKSYKVSFDGLEDIKIHFICGVYDFFSYYLLSSYLFEKHNNVFLHFLKKSGHYPFYEESNQFTKILNGIIKT